MERYEVTSTFMTSTSKPVSFAAAAYGLCTGTTVRVSLMSLVVTVQVVDQVVSLQLWAPEKWKRFYWAQRRGVPNIRKHVEFAAVVGDSDSAKLVQRHWFYEDNTIRNLESDIPNPSFVLTS